MQLKSLLLIFIFFIFTISVATDNVCKIVYKPPGPFHTPRKYQPIVQQLKNIIHKNNWKTNFDMAVSDAHKTGAIEMVNIRNLKEYYNFLNYLVLWVPTEDETGTFVYRMLVTMYFVLDQETVKPFQSPVVPWYPSPPLTELSQWIVDFANDMGKFLNTSQSLTEKSLQTFYTAQNYNVDAYEVSEGGWLGHSYNEFFARKFLPGTRPIDGPSNPAVIVSAADSTFDGCWDIDDDSIVTFKGLPWSIKELLKDSKYANDFAGGKFMHAFLGPYDYHRQHAPVSGKVLEAKVIPGQAYLEVTVQQDPNGKLRLKPIRRMRKMNAGNVTELNAPNSPGYQFCQARGLIVIDSPIGKVAVLPIGMAQVSSVVLSTHENATVYKGEEISYFQFGGSDIVLVFQAQSKVNILANESKHYRVGEQIAISHKKIIKLS
ncbi:phosphatidylserine decarboxylase-related protein [Glomus cerebriforme]|uniref:Phosphatidylserine decarboxylase-related protein n=1 Tax=Glomus cerebriforme TaxID=658196 RepID=A0A397SC74_9GLOM|nr:phosphatidylserine decarboxylase-related protein [Glomus cerebriforme]